MPVENQNQNSCFIAIPYSKEFANVRNAIIKGVVKADFRPISSQDDLIDFPRSIIEQTIIDDLKRTDCIIIDITEYDPNVSLRVGLAQAMGKKILAIAHRLPTGSIPSEFRDLKVFFYGDTTGSLAALSKKVTGILQEYRKSFQSSAYLKLVQTPQPFFTDWERLGEREFENLCRELLAQMGFQHLEWQKELTEIDLVAELPKKDPDGFEYRELWLISIGLSIPFERYIENIAYNLEYFFTYAGRFRNKTTDMSITILMIFFSEHPEFRGIEQLRERLEKLRITKGIGYDIRLRTWDRAYLTSLVQKYPHIGYKYFSDEGRIRSTTRKSYEELYKENSDLVARQADLIAELKEEKNKRIRAERDSVWKDISFSAAHKIGNPIFAIETDLDPLVKRIREQRSDEAVEVVSNIRSSVEKAKAFVEQFKSLARAQEIKPVPTALSPIFADIRRKLSNTGIDCQIEGPSELVVFADPDRLAEVFDELVANANHWFDKAEKKFEIKAFYPAPEPIPGPLDSTNKYVLIQVKDNGCGIPVSDKQRIFDAFFTTFDHGTGLGLALVRRIIEGHAGTILETGIPGQGAHFEIFLPVPAGKKIKKKSPAKNPGRKKKSKE